jgi:signal transduction histidine kinase
MSERAWYRSLYWRIAIGFVLFLAGTLAVQAVLFLWIVVRAEGVLTPEAQLRLATLVASDLSEAIGRDPQVDLEKHLADRYGGLHRPIFVVMADGRVLGGRWGTPPAPAIRAAMRRMRIEEQAAVERFGPLRGRGQIAFAPVVEDGRVVATVVVQRGRPPDVVVRELGPIMLAVGLGLVGAGGALAALLSFRPAHRRLKGLEEAARRLGSGDTSARAPEKGGDEIAAVARTFNQMAADLDRRAEELRAADRARRQLLADVSHELTTPLTAIHGYAETLQMPQLSLDAATRARYLDIIGQETMRLERIVGDLLDLARSEAGGVTLRIQPVPVSDLFERVLMRHRRESEEKGVRLTTSIGARSEIVLGDADRLEQALQNLAANALRHTPGGGRIELRSERRGDSIVLSVADTGEGIRPEHLPHIFDRFYKVDAARAGRPSGSGLGLSIVKAIVEQHGGTVSVSSTPGTGTVFEVLLLAPAQDPAGHLA